METTILYSSGQIANTPEPTHDISSGGGTVAPVLHVEPDSERRAPAATVRNGSGLQVSVLGSFGFSAADGSRPALSGGSQRLLAFLALRNDAVTRGSAAGSLWPDASGDHAGSSLRSALSRLGSTRAAVAATDIDLRLADDVTVDIRESQGLARGLLEPEFAPAIELDATTISALSRDLLPDWYDDWLLPEAEEWRQLRLHALEALSDRLASAGRFAHAMSAALAAVRVDPLRESATAALIRVHLVEGNQADALCEFRRYRALLQRELGVEPTTNLFELVGVSPMASRRTADRRVGQAKWSEVRVARRHR
jgi:DNA-binding SARP family transcriptional activator